MKRPLKTMMMVLIAIILLFVIGLAAYFFFKPGQPHVRKPLTAEQALSLQVAFPADTTNLQTDGLIQFTMTLQASDTSTKSEITAMQANIIDAVNRLMREFTGDELKQVNGYDKLESQIQSTVNQMLQNGKVTKVLLSQIVVQ